MPLCQQMLAVSGTISRLSVYSDVVEVVGLEKSSALGRVHQMFYPVGSGLERIRAHMTEPP